MSKTVLIFGAFDPLHDGHKDLFRQAKMLGDRLLVVVARDGAIRAHKGREPFMPEEDRLMQVVSCEDVDEAILGQDQANRYELLQQLEFAVLAMGYDQVPGDEVVRKELDKIGKTQVPVVRLSSYFPEKFKSTFLREGK